MMFFRDANGRDFPYRRLEWHGDALAWYRDFLRRNVHGQFYSTAGRVESRGDMLALILKGTLPENTKLP